MLDTTEDLLIVEGDAMTDRGGGGKGQEKVGKRRANDENNYF